MALGSEGCGLRWLPACGQLRREEEVKTTPGMLITALVSVMDRLVSDCYAERVVTQCCLLLHRWILTW